MKTNANSYPDISDILERKAAGRVDLHGRSFAEKLDALDALRDRVAPLRAARQSYQRSMSTTELTDEEMDLMRAAKTPAEHDYDYEEDAEPTPGPGMGRRA